MTSPIAESGKADTCQGVWCAGFRSFSAMHDLAPWSLPHAGDNYFHYYKLNLPLVALPKLNIEKRVKVET